MSAQTKTRAQKVGKFLGIALFAFLMFFNIKFAVSDDTSGDIDLFGLKVNSSFSETFASAPLCNARVVVFCRIIVIEEGDKTILIFEYMDYNV